MKKMILATTMAVMVGGGLMAQSRYDRYDDRYNDPYDDYDGRDYGGAMSVYNAPPPPPPPVYGGFRRPACPGPNFIWVDGFWNWRGSRYSWVSGYWAARPHARAFWVGPRYDRGRYFSGYWGGYGRGFDRNRGRGFGYRR